MNLREDLVLIGWLAELAPAAAATPGAGAAAVTALQGRYPSARALDDALVNCLRRAAATAVLQEPEGLDPIAAQRAILLDRDGFPPSLDRTEPAVVAVARLLDALPATRGRGARLSPPALEAFRVQSRDLFPREDMGGAALALAVIQGLSAVADPHRRLALEREEAALQARVGASVRAAELRGPRDGRTFLQQADTASEAGGISAAEAALVTARDLFAAAGDLAGLAAVSRRKAALLSPSDRVGPLFEAVRLARQAKDTRGEAEGFEELSRAYSETGRRAAAIAALGALARLARAAVDPAAEARALQLAGRLLCEAPAGEDDPGAGIVLLLRASDIGGSVDAVIADLVRGYISGFQYTLSDARWAEIEPLLDADRADTVAAVFARYAVASTEPLP